MKHFLLFVLITTTIVCLSCNNSETDAATKWTDEIKTKIIEDAHQSFDQVVLDTARNELTYLKDNKKLKYYYLKPRFNQEIITDFDTASSIYFSADQKFELVKEHCPIVDRSFEGLRYNGNWIGRLEYKYCDGKPKNIHFNYYEKIGIEREYDSTGKLIKETDHGKSDEFGKLNEIKYYR